ncbi:acyltransferase domain-containing protein [Actinoplanes oblitus]|uniref:Acyltransferase domain-containing protein n=1 Tax=Actinoplanes oblitus TaxID=3040509 RepID=A0ABY8W970_9ACTN|nr:acyltransferase domain-containing protein [Actinoplanes oblitus]WIM94414.1 acyltransferase domain-containing protein [Actinoplanes oblitus]
MTGARLLTLTAPTAEALERDTDELAEWVAALDATAFAGLPVVPDTGTTDQPARRAVAASTPRDAARWLRKRDPRRVFTAGPGRPANTAFLFSGVGDQYPGLGGRLHRGLPVMRRELDRCLDLLAAEEDLDLRPLLAPAESPGTGPDLAALFDRRATTQPIHETAAAQPLLFALQYALARALIERGARPTVLAGYSLGEYVAGCLAGVLPVEDALRVVARRARLIDRLPRGAMLVVNTGPESLRPWLPDGVSFAAINGPEQCVLSGIAEAIEGLAVECTARGWACRRTATSHAFHSAMMAPLVQPLHELLETVPLRAPRLPILSTVTGTWLRDAEAADPGYWARHLCETVRFTDVVAGLWRLPDPLLVELGPGQTLARLAQQHPGRPATARTPVVQTLPGQFETRTEDEVLLAAAGQLWASGLEIDLAGLAPNLTEGGHATPCDA